jgi:hypothetical protein
MRAVSLLPYLSRDVPDNKMKVSNQITNVIGRKSQERVDNPNPTGVACLLNQTVHDWKRLHVTGKPQMVLRSKTLLRELMRDRYDTVALAERTGLSKQLIGYLCTEGLASRNSCSTRTANLIAEALGCEVETLFSPPLSDDSDDKERS